MSERTTETLDRLYLEWSQFTDARTSREIAMRDAILEALDHLEPAPDVPVPGWVLRAKRVLARSVGV